MPPVPGAGRHEPGVIVSYVSAESPGPAPVTSTALMAFLCSAAPLSANGLHMLMGQLGSGLGRAHQETEEKLVKCPCQQTLATLGTSAASTNNFVGPHSTTNQQTCKWGLTMSDNGEYNTPRKHKWSCFHLKMGDSPPKYPTWAVQRIFSYFKVFQTHLPILSVV